LRDRLERGLLREIPDLVVHGAGAERLPNTLYAAIPGVPARELLSALPEIATGVGAACHSDRPATPSRVLVAMGVSAELATCTLRLSLGRTTTANDIDRALALLCERATALRASR
jgi:cysteine desulfurase